jgi:hypothetical protein
MIETFCAMGLLYNVLYEYRVAGEKNVINYMYLLAVLQKTMGPGLQYRAKKIKRGITTGR